MVCTFGLYGQPIHPYTKIVDKSIFPTSNANVDCRIGFYAKFYVGIHSTGGGSLISYDTGAAAERKYYKKWNKNLLILLITSIKHHVNLI
jgi:hypothetical protein